MRMAPGIDVRIDPNRDAGGSADPLSNLLNARELSSRFDVNRLGAKRHGAFELRRRFADASEHNVRWKEPSPPGDLNFPDGVRVRGGPHVGKHPRNGERGV